MAQSPQQFTPQQILEAGRRAETEGRIEYAIQFYRHLTDHLARTAEAATARDSLARLGASVASGTGHSPAGPGANGHYHTIAPPGPQPYGAQPMNGHPTGPQQASTGAAPTAGTMPGRPSNGQPGSGALIVRPSPAAPAADAVARRKLVLPKSRRRYRTGRFVARAFTVLGFVEIAIGVVLLGAGLFSKVPALPEFLAAQQQLIGVSAGLTVLILGLVQVMGGQLARAIFDTASANRDLAAYARARAIFETGGADEPPQRD
ncbi:MAG: hypothetical protein ABL904_15560 [Hyphomicrobiaceae bacterium]